MFYHKSNKDILLQGVQFDEPKVFIPWNISEDKFMNVFPNCNVKRIVNENYYFVKEVTIFGESPCNIVVAFEKTMRKINISRDICEEDNSLKDKSIKTPEDFHAYLKKSFGIFQTALESAFGKPTKREESTTAPNFESCEWDIGNKIKIYHYVMDRFGLAEYLFIEKG